MCNSCLGNDRLRKEPLTPHEILLLRRHRKAGTVPPLPAWYVKHMRINQPKPLVFNFRQVLPNPCTRIVPPMLAIPEADDLNTYIRKFDVLNGLKGAKYEIPRS